MQGDLGRWEIARRVNSLLTLCRPGPPVNGLLSAAARRKKKRTPYRAMETARNGAAMPPKPCAAAA